MSHVKTKYEEARIDLNKLKVRHEDDYKRAHPTYNFETNVKHLYDPIDKFITSCEKNAKDYFKLFQQKSKVEKELDYTKKQLDSYWKEVCILKPRLKKVEELLGLYRAKDNVIEKYTKNSFAYFSELERLSYEIKALEKELEELGNGK